MSTDDPWAGFGVSAGSLLTAHSTVISTVPTFCKVLDTAIGGGIQLGEVTELCGLPGAGKTQLLYQILLNTKLPRALSGVGGESLLICTDGSFNPERLMEMATCLYNDTKVPLKKCVPPAEFEIQSKTIEPDSLMRSVHVMYADSIHTLRTIINGLGEYLRENPNIRVVGIDNIANHFRYGEEAKLSGMSHNRSMNVLTQTLLTIAQKQNVGIVCINHLTPKFIENAATKETKSRLAPALGNVFAAGIHTSVVLGWDLCEGTPTSGARLAYVARSPNLAEHRYVHFQIDSRGIRKLNV